MDALLHANDLSALECYRELTMELGGKVLPSVQQLGASVEQLDFDAARAHLKTVEAELAAL